MSFINAADGVVDNLAGEKSPGKFERKIFLYVIALLLMLSYVMGLRYITRLETDNAEYKTENKLLREAQLKSLQEIIEEKQSRLDETRNYHKFLDSIKPKISTK